MTMGVSPRTGFRSHHGSKPQVRRARGLTFFWSLTAVYSLKASRLTWEAHAPFSSRGLSMKRLLLTALLLGGGTALCSAADFEPPVRLKAGDAAIRVESPGFAFPCWANLKGEKHLLVGQFNQ